MDSFILEDVNELIKLKKGDNSRLIRIKEACESKEIVSLSDRKYVERLTSQYLRVPEKTKPKNQDKPKFVPIEEDVSSKKDANLTINQTPQIEKPELPKEQLILENSEEKTAPKIRNLNPDKKVIFSIGAVALAIILIGVFAIGYGGIQLQDSSGITRSDPLTDFSIKTDKSSYETSDIISISGKMSSSSQGTVSLSIENENSELIWRENLNLKNNGEFSTLLIAGGQGWENSGKYFLKVKHNEFSNEISFEFIAR